VAIDITLGRFLPSSDGAFRDIYQLMAGTNVIHIYGGRDVNLPCVWDLVGLKATVTTDATVADRKFSIASSYDSQITYEYWQSSAISASKVVTVHLSRGSGWQDITPYPAAGGNYYATIKDYTFIADGSKGVITISLSTGKAGDSVAVHMRFKSLNKEMGIEIPSVSCNPPPESRKWCLW